MSGETGSVKFSCDRVPAELLRFAGFDELNRARRELIDVGLVGIDPNGVGFGNLSVRDGDTAQFYITGSGTGGLVELAPGDCAKVVSYDFTRNRVRCEGETIASSESLTHAAIYESDPNVFSVIHCHDRELWKALLNKAPTTPAEAEYGTPEMAFAVKRLFEQTDVKRTRIFVMTGHESGVVLFGKSFAESAARLRVIRYRLPVTGYQ